MSRKKNRIRIAVSMALTSMLWSCAVLKSNTEIHDISMRYDKNAPILYGKSLKVDFYANYVGGKSKKITKEVELEVAVSGGLYSNGKVQIIDLPEKLMDDQLRIKASYSTKKDTIHLEEVILFNYTDYLTIEYSGAHGQDGEDGDNGGKALLFKNGKDGENGIIGGNGLNGDDITVFVWERNNTELINIKIENSTQQTTHFFTYKRTGPGIKLYVLGGNGGQGGSGGDGGNGNDGETTKKKIKPPGNGGDGANGGNGGHGGDGGFVVVYIHPNVRAMRKLILVFNNGGSAGNIGQGGEGGSGGDPLTGQNKGTNGQNGIPGQKGILGKQGPETQLLIKEFDIE